MCTVTLITRQQGYFLGMNRDEKLTRPAGRPPRKRRQNDRIVIAPSEPGGGTWIAVNDLGISFSLINWYAIAKRVEGGAVSRGAVVNAASSASSPKGSAEVLSRLPLKRINPFRLIGVFPSTREVVEWRWDLRRLAQRTLRWKTQQWISSGFDEPRAQVVRSKTFRMAMHQRTAGSIDWLRRLHGSHAPQRGPFSTCMHRADAVTVSYTEVAISPRDGVLRHYAGAMCHHPARSTERFRLRPS